MHPNPIYRQTSKQRALAFARDRSFGIVTVSTPGAPLVSHLPFLLSPDNTRADMHLVRSNPICRAISHGQSATLIVSGPDGYISPDWYETDDQVPTWNYVSVHLIGTLRPLPPESLEDMLARQSAAYEARLSPKAPWTMDKMSDETKTRFLRMILPFRFDIEDVQSTWKLGQNKPDKVRLNAAQSVTTGFGAELDLLAAQMSAPPLDE